MSRETEKSSREKISSALLIGMMIFLYACVFLQVLGSPSALAQQVLYREDVDRNGVVDEQDVVGLILLQRTTHGSHIADYNDDLSLIHI